MAAAASVGAAAPARDSDVCPLIPQRTKADCPVRCRGCGWRAGAVGTLGTAGAVGTVGTVGSAGAATQRAAPASAEAATPEPRHAAALCPRVPHRMKYTCSGKCPGCRSRDELEPTGEAAAGTARGRAD